MSKLTDRLERDLREVAAGAQPSPSAWESIEARLGGDGDLEPATLVTLERSGQKRPVWAAVAAAALVAIVGSIAVVTRAGDDQPTFADDLTSTFVSPRNGFSVKHPEGAAISPATGDGTDGFDVVDTGLDAVFQGRSSEVFGTVEGVAAPSDAVIDTYVSDEGANPDGCGVPRRQQAEITIDGQAGRVGECPNQIEATVVAGGKLYIFILSHERNDARVLFDALVATIDLTPETTVHFPGMEDTFVSPTYGFTFGYLDRGGFEPATEQWDPTDQQFDVNFYKRFDYLDTGFGAGFAGASTKIPEGVSVDEWVDEYVTPAAVDGCGVPRNQQAEITIDGQAGQDRRVRRSDRSDRRIRRSALPLRHAAQPH